MTRRYWPRLFDADVAIRTEAPNVPAQKRAAALRWRVSPRIGLPRAPFKVFQRPRASPLPYLPAITPLFKGPLRLTGQTSIDWGAVPAMEVTIEARPDANQKLVFQALDDRQQPIPGETVTLGP